MEYREKLSLEKNIKKSTKVHSERPFTLKFRVGQVVQHISEGYRGVIIEWESHSAVSILPFYIILTIKIIIFTQYSTVILSIHMVFVCIGWSYGIYDAFYQ